MFLTIRTRLFPVFSNNCPLPQEVVQTGSMPSQGVIWWHESGRTVNKFKHIFMTITQDTGIFQRVRYDQ